MITKDPYVPGDLWETRHWFLALNVKGEKVYIPVHTKIMILASVAVAYKESIKFFHDGQIYYVDDIDVAHYFDFMKEFNERN